MPYYERFVQAYPTIQDLAEATEGAVLKLWQGLGYYSRARNLHSCARTIASDYHGLFPNSYAELLKLKGVGKYTAAAIASICFDEAVPAIDGNAFRVLSRAWGIRANIAEAGSFHIFFEIGKSLMPAKNRGLFNQAVMDLGATICLAKNPKCDKCPVRLFCDARKHNMVEQLPVKIKKLKIKKRKFDYHVFSHSEKVLVRQRMGKDIWKGLYEFFLLERSDDTPLEANLGLLKNHRALYQTQETLHTLTHQKLFIRFFIWKLDQPTFDLIKNMYQMLAINRSELYNFAVPKPIERFLKNEYLLLS